jgi:hypothetical protein
MRQEQPIPAALDRWLTAEREGSTSGGGGQVSVPAYDPGGATADLALRELLTTCLPPLAPPAGFADRVMARATVSAAVAARAVVRRASPWSDPWLRSALLLCVATCGFALLWLPALLQSLGNLWSPAELFEKSIGGLMTLHLWLAAAFGVGQKLVLLCEAFAAPLAITPLALLAVACLLISAVAFRVLRALIHSDRRWVYVDPI